MSNLETAGKTQIPVLLWDAFPKVFDRMKTIRKTFEDFSTRYLVQAEAEKVFHMNIKSRKYVELAEGGSLNENWLKMKDRIQIFEEMGKGMESKYRVYDQATKQELDEYGKFAKQLESDYNDIRKKKANALDDMKRKNEKYRSTFKEWEDIQGEIKSTTITPEKKSKLQQQLPQKEALKNQHELAYKNAMTTLQAVETEYDTLCTELLVRFEENEIKRITEFKKRVKEFFTVWNMMIEKYQKSIGECSELAQQINVKADLIGFANANDTGLGHDPDTPIILLGEGQDQTPSGGARNTPSPTEPVSKNTKMSQSMMGTLTNSAPKQQAAPSPLAPSSSSSSSSSLFPPEQMVAGGKLMQMLYEYEDTNSNTGTYNVGEVIQVTNVSEAASSGWAMAMKKNSAAQGYVPYNYLGEVSAAAAAPAPAPADAAVSAATVTQPTATVVQQPAFEIPTGMQKGTAMYAYEAASANETSIVAEEVLAFVPDTTNSGWVYIQRASGNAGYVPANYISPA